MRDRRGSGRAIVRAMRTPGRFAAVTLTFGLALVGAAGCARDAAPMATRPAPVHAPVAPVAEARPPGFTLVESVPIETALDHADLPDASDVWLAMITGARRSIDL